MSATYGLGWRMALPCCLVTLHLTALVFDLPLLRTKGGITLYV